MLLKQQIIEARNNNRIVIEPYNVKNIGPNSYDVTLGDTLCVYDMNKCGFLDCKKQNPIITIVIPDDGLILVPNTLYLGHTIEKIGSDHYVPLYEGRSSMGRLGILSHISAGFGDVGFKDQWTLEITVVHPVKIYKGMRIGQVYFNDVNQSYNVEENRYHGKYIEQSGPQPSKSHIDFE